MAVSKTYDSLCYKYKTIDMSYSRLSDEELCDYDLTDGIFIASDLYHVNLSGSCLSAANFMYADLSNANLTNADLTNADLHRANLANAILTNANLTSVDLRGTVLTNAILSGAIMNNVITDEQTAGYWPVCPIEGAFVAYKQVWKHNHGYRPSLLIAKLMIPATAKRSSATTRKCRCSAAKVLALYHPNGRKTSILKAYSCFDSDFDYTVGKTVTADSFDPDRWHECSHGIHFFMTFEEAKIYS